MRAYRAFFVVQLMALIGIALGTSMGGAFAADLATLLSDKDGISADILAGQRGGTAPSASATVTDNTAFTGVNNSVNEVANSMNGAQGLFNVVQNSGNNVAIQSQITVNATLH